MALKLGTGGEAYAPLAQAIIGGLAVSVVLTVFIVPAAYLLTLWKTRCRPFRRTQGKSRHMKKAVCFMLLLCAAVSSAAPPMRRGA